MEKRINDWLKSLGLGVEITLSAMPDKWHKLNGENFKGAWIFSEIGIGGKTKVFVTVKDWRGETWTKDFSSEKLTKEEQDEAKFERAKHLKFIAREKERLQREAQAQCQKTWDSLAFGPLEHQYIVTKKVEVPDQTLKMRVLETGEKQLLAPLFNVENEFWGYQIINENGEKLFLDDQRTQGCFTPIGRAENSTRIYLCEGVATALSVYQGLSGEYPVFACLYADNLGSVASEVRRKYPKSAIVVCADNDQHTAGNPGLLKAETVAHNVDGVVVHFPVFHVEHLQNKPTDWNDFHQLYGLESLKTQLAQVKVERPEFLWSLGHLKGEYFFSCSRNPEVMSTKDFSNIDLFKFLSLKKWIKLYPDAVSEKGAINWDVIKSDLIDRSQRQGLYKPSRSRGVGIYLEGDRPVVHLGDKIFADSQIFDLQDFQTENVYEQKSHWQLPQRPTNFDKDEFVKALLEVLSGYTWESELAPALIMGWIYCAYACGSLEWRPHLLVSGKRASGKSTIVDKIVVPLLSSIETLHTTNTTEAGIRQHIENDAIPFVHDEFDTNKKQKSNLSGALDALREASSGGQTLRGDRGQKGRRFELKFCAYLTGINPPNLNEADQTRITHLRLVKPNPQNWHQVLKPKVLDVSRKDNARGVFWRVVDTLPSYGQSYEVLQGVLSEVEERVGQQFGALLAGFWHLKNDHVIPLEKAQAFLAQLKSAQASESLQIESEDNAVRCLERLLDFGVRVRDDNGRTEISLNHALAEPSDIYISELEQIGVRKLKTGEIFVRSNHAGLTDWFAQSDFVNYSEALLRMPGARRTTQKIGGKAFKGVAFSLPEVTDLGVS